MWMAVGNKMKLRCSTRIIYTANYLRLFRYIFPPSFLPKNKSSTICSRNSDPYLANKFWITADVTTENKMTPTKTGDKQRLHRGDKIALEERVSNMPPPSTIVPRDVNHCPRGSWGFFFCRDGFVIYFSTFKLAMCLYVKYVLPRKNLYVVIIVQLLQTTLLNLQNYEHNELLAAANVVNFPHSTQ